MPEWLRQANQFSQETTIRVMLSSLSPRATSLLHKQHVLMWITGFLLSPLWAVHYSLNGS